jgi:hypothetical protein
MSDPTAQNLAVREDLMSLRLGYAQALRAIGQALETLNINDFEMTPVGDGYAIQGKHLVPCDRLTPDGLTSSHVWAIWGDPNGWQRTRKKTARLRSQENHAALELQYTPADIERLELEGRAKRFDASGIADASKLSHMLRCIGFYLSQKCARMRRLLCDGDCFSVEYETSLGSKVKETFGVADLYDFWVRSYLHRADRALQQAEPVCD